MTAPFDFAHKNALRSGCLAVIYFGGVTLLNEGGLEQEITAALDSRRLA